MISVNAACRRAGIGDSGNGGWYTDQRQRVTRLPAGAGMAVALLDGERERRGRMGDREADRVLVERVQAGDKQAFGLLVAKYQNRLARLVARTVGDAAEVDDIVQESFIRAYRALPNFRHESAFYTWLYRIGINTARNWMASQGAKHRHVALDDEDEAEGLDEPGTINDQDTPEQLLMSRQVGDAVNAAVAALPEDFRTAITLREIEGLSYEEIARVMDCPVNTVRTRIYRAREAIAARLKPMLDVAADRRW